MIPSLDSFRNFFVAVNMLQQPLEHFIANLQSPPSCMISDKYLAFTAQVARKFQIPRIIFDGTSCFNLLCIHNLHNSNVLEDISDHEKFFMPGLPNQIEFTWAQLPSPFNPGSLVSHDMKKNRDRIREGELGAYGVVINSFEELEREYVERYRKAKGEKVWCIGPVSLYNKEDLDRAQRGNKSSIDENKCLQWLNSQKPGSVVYACLGTLTDLTTPQLIELGLGLEVSEMPFIWVIKAGKRKEEIEKWLLEDGFEERTKDRGLLIRGWAPQLLILSHRAIGGFLTHCGWNSTRICAGAPMVAWPIFSEQFFNEKLIVQVMGIGVGVGAKVVVHLCEEDKFGVLVKREDMKTAIEKVMDKGRDGQERRERARELQKMANMAMEGGGSSYTNLTLLIEDIMQQAARNQEAKTLETFSSLNLNY
ncbi:UDP-glycosyltransferase [Actinidia chinensis var. chinensis]|uniref:UDP-glycosyltransferase n=1 Tax=Actinidia chinensis var. chinensis TaxID=1590841 RepID=A0A2R6Q9P7_ACTCC|nr:UDP-glycosyltransferase [Actinidia chinensis var. chinensis]